MKWFAAEITMFYSLIVLVSCSGGIDSRFPMEKRFWGPKEYDQVVHTIRFKTPEGERLPEFSNPETSPVIKKLVDEENFKVVLEDEELGLSHRNDMAQDFFNEYRDLVKAYNKVDRQDKYVYGRELISVMQFGLALQIPYFKLGNDLIEKEADNPDSGRIKDLLRSNVNTIYSNFTNYLDYVNNESYFTEDELKLYSDGISKYFELLFETFPNGNKGGIKNKTKLMLDKASDPYLKSSLQSLLDKIEA